MLQDIARAWRDTLQPTHWRLAFSVVSGCTGTSIVEHRLMSGRAQPGADPAWCGGWEYGFLVFRHNLSADKKGTAFITEVAAFASLHCIGRWLARNVDSSESALLRDLTTLALSSTAPGCDTLHVPTPFGAWGGKLTPVTTPDTGRRYLARAARTFIAADMANDRLVELGSRAGANVTREAIR
jgi:hypothetical protein